MKTLSVIVVVAFGLAVMPLQSQVPIDLSQAREFKLVWKQQLSGTMFPIQFVPSVCDVAGLDVLAGATLYGRFTWRTNPRIDTVNIDQSLGIWPTLIDADGTPPLEYVNTRGHIMRCAGGDGGPFPLVAIDTVAGCAGEPQAIGDVDGDGIWDVITDIGGGGYTARVIRGGPQAGRGCQRILQIPKVMGADQFNTTKAFWRSSSGTWRMLQDEKDAMALSPWLMLYEMRLEHLSEGTRITWVKTDSMYGNGNHINDIPVGDAAVVTDTTTGRDWLMIMRRLNNGPRTWVLERFDATDGRFTPTGEQVTGVEFYAPWNAGYSLGTSRPVIMLGEGSFCYADNLRQPFARVRFKNSGLQPVSGFVAINDQTGDGKPDLIASGGTTDGAVALYTLDSLTSTIGEQNSAKTLPIVELIQQTLITTVDRPMTASVSLATTDGRHFPIVTPWQTSTGTQRVDLGQYLGDLPRGVYFVRVTLDATVHTLQFVRP
jgi:hypothetical protein